MDSAFRLSDVTVSGPTMERVIIRRILKDGSMWAELPADNRCALLKPVEVDHVGDYTYGRMKEATHG